MMIRKCAYIQLLIIAVLGFSLRCVTTNSAVSPQQRQQRMLVLARRIQANPEDANALKELGILFVKTEDYRRGKIILERALKLKPDDPESIFTFGLALEFQDEKQKAFEVYRSYLNLPGTSQYRKMMKARYDAMLYDIMRLEARDLLSQEQQLGTETVSPNSVAVFPFRYNGENAEYASLGKGLCEMIITDLSQIEELQLIERIRLQAMMEEISLQQTGLMDTETAPQAGKLLSAGQILHGAYDILGTDRFRVDLRLVDLIRQTPPLRADRTDDLTNLFMMEKRIVLAMIGKMEIELSPVVRERILRIPTKNLQAFMAYCKGLEKQDAGQFSEAVSYFNQATRLDPDFEMASQKAEESESLVQLGTEAEAILSALDRTREVPITAPDAVDLINNRLQIVTENMSVNFVPGQENRNATEEATTAGANIGLGDLPDPPRPPGSRR